MSMVAAFLAFSPVYADAEPKITKMITPEAELTTFTMAIEDCKMAKKPCLTFKLKVKNVTNSPKRFVTRIVLTDSGNGVGGFIPRKGKPPVVEPGKEASATYPMFHYEIPQNVEIVIDVMK
jgi:hypothetical protein